MAPDPAGIALDVASRHPSYEGHFPGHPILPGAALLAEALSALEGVLQGGLTSWTLASAKFVSPATPGMPLRLSHERQPSGSIRFDVLGPHGVVATGLLVPRRMEVEAP